MSKEHIRKPSPYLRRRIDMLDYEVEKNLNAIPFVGTTLCSFFKSDIEYFESIMENSIDAMYYNYFSHMDDNSGKWAHEYLDMVNYIRNKYQDKIMKHYNDNCGSGSIPLKESIRKVLKEELNESTYLRRRVDMSSLDKKFFTNLNIVTDKYLKRHVGYCSFNVFRTTVISYLIDDYRDNLSDEDYDNFPYDEVYNFLFNLFYDKIKDRYVEVFGGDINESENIKKVLREIEEDRIQIRLGRSVERHFGTVQNIIIQVDNEDITGQDGESGLGKMNIVIKDGEIIVGDIFIPEKYRRQGIATQVYQKISDHFGLPIVNSKTKGFNQTMEGGYMWKDREKFEPRNLQESIRRILREEKDTDSDWKKRNGGLTKKYKFSDYDETISFVNKVAKIAKKQNHHPDIKVGYDVVEISITDHEKGGVSEKCHKFIKEVNNIK